ncbi:MAG: hypothetical protein H7Y36_12350 [Armatimonadetes bacterium]|nr:hypothetical protein [Akkermansiaceae bacterium]
MPTPHFRSKAGRVRILTSRHGLGDCHLLRFKKPDGSAYHILIDCGVVDVTPDPKGLMTRVAEDIVAETGGVIDVVVATHQHTDHLSGFNQASAVFDKVTFQELWLSWMDEPNNKLAQKLQKELVKNLGAVRLAAARMHGVGMSAAVHVKGILDFFGPSVAGEKTQDIIEALRGRKLLKKPPIYQKTGNCFTLKEVPDVRVYVLGPPEDPKDLKVMNPRKGEGYEALQLSAHTNGFVLAFAKGEEGHPFDRCHRKRTCKFPSYSEKDLDWRKIDDAWLQEAERLALYLDDFTNNTSLALAFEFIDTGEVLLFPGDAQIGSWISWEKLTWRVPGADGEIRNVRIKDLLERTVFYKGSHHASHNGTPHEAGTTQVGLEQMTHSDLVCVVPVDINMSIKKRWDRTLPWPPLLNRLREITRGRLILTDVAQPAPSPAKLKDLTPAERKRFKNQVTTNKHWVEFLL